MSSHCDRARKAPDDSEPTGFTPDQSKPRIEGPAIPLCLSAGQHCCSDSMCSSVSQARAVRRRFSAHNQQLQLLVDSQQQNLGHSQQQNLGHSQYTASSITSDTCQYPEVHATVSIVNTKGFTWWLRSWCWQHQLCCKVAESWC